jgi:hypothetical protein
MSATSESTRVQFRSRDSTWVAKETGAPNRHNAEQIVCSVLHPVNKIFVGFLLSSNLWHGSLIKS